MGQYKQGILAHIRQLDGNGAMPDEALHRAGHVWIGCYYKASALPKG